MHRRLFLALALKQAIEAPPSAEEVDVSHLRDADRLISGRVYRVLVKEFKTRLMPFFDLYGILHGFAGGKAGAPSEGFAEHFRGYSRMLHTGIKSPEVEAQFSGLASKLRPLLARLDEGHADQALLVRAGNIYADLIKLVARDRGIYLALKSTGRWSLVRMMGEKERRIEELRAEDPELFDAMQKSKEVSKTLDKAIEKAIADTGMVPSTRWIWGKPIHIGKDTVTGEEFAYDEAGEGPVPLDTYIERRKQKLREVREQERVFPKDLDQLRKVSDASIEAAAGPVQYVALSDDTVQQRALTRIYPIKNVEGVDVVVEGRFKGIALPDLVNAAGRMIEGTAYDFDPKVGRPVPIETKNPDGSPNIRTMLREPYCTVSQGKLLLRLPSVHEYTEHRRRISDLAKVVPSIRETPKSRKSLFEFEPKDFAAVREALGGLSLSTAAMKLIRDYFTELAKHELATKKENLVNFSAEAIGGFKQGTKLLVKQQEAVAWLESRKGAGVIALDTGVGKTLTVITAIQKSQRDEAGGKYLYVCPPALRGNLAKEAYRFLEDPQAFLDSVDVMSYTQFTKARKQDPEFGKQYRSVFFDEAQALKNPGSGQSKAAMTMDHPRKVLLTASPMERSPMEVFTLAAISSNQNLNTPEGRVAMRAFRQRHAEEVGGRIVGVKDDPVSVKDMRVWVRQRLFFADKRNVEEFALPGLTKQVETLTMEDVVETKYREVASGVADVLQGLTAKYRDRAITPETQNKALETARIKLAKLFAQLTLLSNQPDRVIPGAKNHKLERLVQIMDQKAGSESRVVLFTDSPDMALATADTLSERCPWKDHAVALSDRIEVIAAGGLRTTYRKREYTDADGTKIPAKDWQVFVMKKMIAGNRQVGTVTLTSAYAVGHNLQEFDTVIHLDRDTWNSETMKQRTARLWRQGQDKPVTEMTLDTVYQSPGGSLDSTLDQIRRYVQELDSDLFDSVVIDSQTEALGAEFFTMKQMHSSFFKLNRRMMEMALSPYLRNVGDTPA